MQGGRADMRSRGGTAGVRGAVWKERGGRDEAPGGGRAMSRGRLASARRQIEKILFLFINRKETQINILEHSDEP